MHKLLADVKKFHETYGQPILDVPTIPQDRIELRLSLIKEETKELKKAINDADIVEVADALVDLMYVINGAILEFGIWRRIFDDSYDIESFYNSTDPTKPTTKLSKADLRSIRYLSVVTRELENALKHNHINDVIECLTDLVEMTIIIAIGFGLKDYFYKCHDEVQASNMSKLGIDGKPIYREDGKVLKGPNFFKPNLAKIING